MRTPQAVKLYFRFPTIAIWRMNTAVNYVMITTRANNRHEARGAWRSAETVCWTQICGILPLSEIWYHCMILHTCIFLICGQCSYIKSEVQFEQFDQRILNVYLALISCYSYIANWVIAIVFNLTWRFGPWSNLTSQLDFYSRFPNWWSIHFECLSSSAQLSRYS